MTLSFSTEFDQRLRRVCGVTDDSREVSYEAEFDAPAFEGCETCGYGGDEGRSYVTVNVRGTEDASYVYKEFADMGELMRALDAVEL